MVGTNLAPTELEVVEKKEPLKTEAHCKASIVRGL